MTPPIRVIPPSYSHVAANDDAIHVAYLADDQTTAARLAATLGLAVDSSGDTLRITGSWHELDLLQRALASEVHPDAPLLRRYLQPVTEWKLRSRSLHVDEPVIMGIVNVTDDSFSGDGVGGSAAAARARADELREAGASIIDIGAESARADRPVADEAEEAKLISACVAELAKVGHIVSVDTYKAAVARVALESGAEIVNDISGLTQGIGAAEEAIRANAGYILNYSYSEPKRRPDQPPHYHDVVVDTLDWMFERVAQLRSAGLDDTKIIVDPGIAFGKSHDEDMQVLRRIGEFRTLGLPVLLAHSRKNYIGSATGVPPVARDLETHVTTTLAYAQGIRIFRVHDVEGAARATKLAAAIVDGQPGVFAPDGSSWPWAAGAQPTPPSGKASDKAPPPGQRW